MHMKFVFMWSTDVLLLETKVLVSMHLENVFLNLGLGNNVLVLVFTKKFGKFSKLCYLLLLNILTVVK